MSLSARNWEIYLLLCLLRWLFARRSVFLYSEMELVQFINEVSKKAESDKENVWKIELRVGNRLCVYFCVHTLNLNATKHKPIY